MKTLPVGAEMLHAGRRTDGQMDRRRDGQMERRTNMTKLSVAFRHSNNVPKNLKIQPTF
jgi:hypothetical protein